MGVPPDQAPHGPHRWPQRRLARDVLLLFTINTMLSLSAIYISRQPGSIAAIWLANAAAIAFIVTASPRVAPALVASAALSNLVVNLLHGDPWTMSLAFAAPNTIEVVLGSWLIRRTGQVERFSADHRSFLRVLAAGSLVAPLAGATVGAALLQLLQFGRFERVWLDWYVGSTISSVALLPLAISLRAMRFGEWAPRVLRWRPIALSGLLLVGSTLCLHYLTFPFVVIGTLLVLLAALVSRLLMFTFALLVVCSMAVALGFGWFVPRTDPSALGHAQVYFSMLLVVGLAQVVGVLIARQRALDDMLSAVGSREDSIVVFADMAGVCRWVNRAAATYSGVSNEAVLGRTFQENTPAYPLLKPLMDQAFAGSVAHAQGDFETRARGRRAMDLVIHPALDEEGRQIGVVLCGTDVTELETSRRELVQVVEELRAANGDLEQFVHIASHDLREPLNTIAQFCDVITQTKAHEFDDPTRRYFGLVRSGASRMRTLLDDVLKFVRIGAEDPALQARVDLDAVVAEVVQSLQSQLEATEGKVHVDALGQVQGHRSLISLALQNLISNAIKFVPPERHPEVHVTAAASDGELRLTISDNGIGIDVARIRELGMPFRRLHSRRRFEGTGLGLAICKRIAEQNGGRLEIESTPGEGSRFHLILLQR